MRRIVLALILATAAATPAMAQSTPEERRAEREKARAERTERADRPARADRSEARIERIEQRREQAPDRVVAPRQGERAAVAQRDRPTLEQRREARDGVASWRQEQRDQLRQSRAGRPDRPDRVVDRSPRPRVTPPPSARPNVPAPPPRTARHAAAPQWRSSWHNDRRYDWRDHRRRYGSLFRLGFYFDPFGWNYQRYGRGWRLWPSYYQSSYWLSDPSMYRLPYAPHPYKWIRYWDDALLVDTYSGQVVDVVHDFFW